MIMNSKYVNKVNLAIIFGSKAGCIVMLMAPVTRLAKRKKFMAFLEMYSQIFGELFSPEMKNKKL